MAASLTLQILAGDVPLESTWQPRYARMDAATCARYTALQGSLKLDRVPCLWTGCPAAEEIQMPSKCQPSPTMRPNATCHAYCYGSHWQSMVFLAHCCKACSSAISELTAGGCCASACVACRCGLPPPRNMPATPCHMPPSQPATPAASGAPCCDAASAAATAVVPLPVA